MLFKTFFGGGEGEEGGIGKGEGVFAGGLVGCDSGWFEMRVFWLPIKCLC